MLYLSAVRIVCFPDLDRTMKVELESAVKFIISMLRAGHRARMVRSKGDKFFLEPEIEMLQVSLLAVMSRQYKDFWFPDSPNRGSAYRCIRINKDKMDPIIAKAAASCGLSCNLIRTYLPDELTLWVDPAEVSYRIGEEDGSICVLYEGPLTAAAVPARYETPSPQLQSASSGSSSSSSPPSYNNSSHHLLHQQQQQQHHLRQQQQHLQQQQQQHQQQQHQQQHQTVVVASEAGGNYSNYTSPVKPSSVLTFVPPTYGSPVQFVPYQSYPTYISS